MVYLLFLGMVRQARLVHGLWTEVPGMEASIATAFRRIIDATQYFCSWYCDVPKLVIIQKICQQPDTKVKKCEGPSIFLAKEKSGCSLLRWK